MAVGFGRNEILSVIAGGALAVPMIAGCAGMLLAMGHAPAIAQAAAGLHLPWKKPVPGVQHVPPPPAVPGARPTPMAIPHRAPAAHHAAAPAHHAAAPAHHAAPAIHHDASDAAPMPHHAAPRRQDAIAAMRIEHDDANAQTRYVDPATDPADRSASGLHCYVVQADDHGRPKLRMRTRWVSRKSADRLGIEALYFYVDRKRYAVDNPPYGLLEVQGDVSVTAEQAWEWYDADVDRARLAMLRAIAASRTAVIRYDGREGQAKHLVTAAEKAAIARVLAAYDALLSAAPPSDDAGA